MLVATDVAARGLDVNDLTHVINYNLPDDTEVYIHRSGRTGRADKTGTCISIINPEREIQDPSDRKENQPRIPEKLKFLPESRFAKSNCSTTLTAWRMWRSTWKSDPSFR